MSSRSLSRKPATLTLLFFVLTALVAVPIPWADASLVHGYPWPDAVPNAGLLSRSDLSTTARLDDSFGRLPLYFVENRGQTDARVAYTVLGGATQVYFTADCVTFALMEPDAGGSRGRDGKGEALPRESLPGEDMGSMGGISVGGESASNASPLRGPDAAPRRRWAVKLDFVGANPHARPVGENQTEAVVSYFKGAPDQCHAGKASPPSSRP
jgi:hypothetical protein